MNMVLPVFFCAALIGLFAPKRKMTPTLWWVMIGVILFIIINMFRQANTLIAAAGGHV